jgi:transposase-like protein
MYYCPACKSPEIYTVAGGYMGQVYLCKKCGYRGSFVLEIDDAGMPGEKEKIDKDRK